MMRKSYICSEDPLYSGPTMIGSNPSTILPACAKRRLRAFTLAELVIVVLIIGGNVLIRHLLKNAAGGMKGQRADGGFQASPGQIQDFLEEISRGRQVRTAATQARPVQAQPAYVQPLETHSVHVVTQEASGGAPGASADDRWFVSTKGKRYGPFTAAQMAEMTAEIEALERKMKVSKAELVATVREREALQTKVESLEKELAQATAVLEKLAGL